MALRSAVAASTRRNLRISRRLIFPTPLSSRAAAAIRRYYHEFPNDSYGSFNSNVHNDNDNDVDGEITAQTPTDERKTALSLALDILRTEAQTHSPKLSHLIPLFPRKQSALDAIKNLAKSKGLDTLLFSEDNKTTAANVMRQLADSYAGHIGYEISHISSTKERKWLTTRIERSQNVAQDSSLSRRSLKLLLESQTLDNFLAKKYPSVKRYGLEGAETMLVAMDAIFAAHLTASQHQIIMCMPHRGRINALVNLLQVRPRRIFAKLNGNAEIDDSRLPKNLSTLDVISHLGADARLAGYLADKNLVSRVRLINNPSHLELVSPVSMGATRAKLQQQQQQQQRAKYDTSCTAPLLNLIVHGDASYAAQGVAFESHLLAKLPHYSVGGSIHLVVNNQLGFTTPAALGRSSAFCTDVAKSSGCPIFHVNGTSPDSVSRVCRLAIDYRNEFHKDAVIDINVFRRWGHNELDEPAFTQPVMYGIIRGPGLKSIPDAYEAQLLADKFISQDICSSIRAEFEQFLENEHQDVIKGKDPPHPEPANASAAWSRYMPTASSADSIKCNSTAVTEQVFKSEAAQSVHVPERITIHPRLEKLHVQARLSRLQTGAKIDWATAEAAAFGTLLREGHHVRVSGQDVGRGTFSQRHAMLVDQKTGRVCVPLNECAQSDPKRAKLEVCNSPLSELAVLGYEHGYSMSSPESLVIFEAQFGDFINCAQPIIDTFVSSSEAKWLKLSSLVLLLPHGYDGAGPEHSSCRLERMLALSNDDTDASFPKSNIGHRLSVNLGVAFPTTPAQYFHLLRRQIHAGFRKPLVIASPKTLLRLPAASSEINNFTSSSQFQPLIHESFDLLNTSETNPVARVVLCTGKVYYDLVNVNQPAASEEKSKTGTLTRVEVIRIEELSPFPAQELLDALKKISANCKIQALVWCQEEPRNQGAFTFVASRIAHVLSQLKLNDIKLEYCGRRSMAAPAEARGLASHNKEQNQIVATAFHGNK